MPEHKSVLLHECIENLNIKPDGIYVDGTLGLGGHSMEIAKRLTTGRLIAIDQDETAIEMSRRGYVVLALDMYDHGHSHGNADNTGGFFNFWPTSLWDAAQYMYSQDYVAKDAQGNGQIAVSGHSIHGNSAANGSSAAGFECYPSVPGRTWHAESYYFAQKLAEGMQLSLIHI